MGENPMKTSKNLILWGVHAHTFCTQAVKSPLNIEYSQILLRLSISMIVNLAFNKIWYFLKHFYKSYASEKSVHENHSNCHARSISWHRSMVSTASGVDYCPRAPRQLSQRAPQVRTCLLGLVLARNTFLAPKNIFVL